MAYLTPEERAEYMNDVKNAKPARRMHKFEFEGPEATEFPPHPDVKPQLDGIAKAVAGLKPVQLNKIEAALVSMIKGLDGIQDGARATMLLGQEVALVRKAIEKIKVGDTDLTAVVRAIEANTAATNALAKTMAAPKRFILDEDDKPVGIELNV